MGARCPGSKAGGAKATSVIHHVARTHDASWAVHGPLASVGKLCVFGAHCGLHTGDSCIQKLAYAERGAC